MDLVPKILRAFAPEEAVPIPDMFAGREPQIRALAESLHDRGSIPIIYGHRGVGKTSVALQHEAMAMGDDQILTRIGADALQLTPFSTYKVLWLEGSGITGSTSLIRALNARIENELPPAQGKQPTKETRSIGFDVKALKGTAQKEYVNDFPDVAPESNLERVLEQYRRRNPHRILLIIDEFDRATGRDEIAAWLHGIRSSDLRVVLVGIAKDYHDLIGHHPSLQRKLRPVYVPPMTRDELGEILDRARLLLAREDARMTVEPAARDTLVDSCGGFPWFMHYLGREAFIAAVEHGRTHVNGADVSNAKQKLAQAHWAEHLERLYVQIAAAGGHVESALRYICQNADPISQELPASSLRSYMRNIEPTANLDLIVNDLRTLHVLSRVDSPVSNADSILVLDDPYLRIYVNSRRRINSPRRISAALGGWDPKAVSERLNDSTTHCSFPIKGDPAEPCTFIMGPPVPPGLATIPVLARGYVLQDTIARFQYMRGDPVVSHYSFAGDAEEVRSSRDLLRRLGIMADWSRSIELDAERFAQKAQDYFVSMLKDQSLVTRQLPMHFCPAHQFPRYVFGEHCEACGAEFQVTSTSVWYLRSSDIRSSPQLENVRTGRIRAWREGPYSDNQIRATDVLPAGIPVPAVHCETCGDIPLEGEQSPATSRDLPSRCPVCQEALRPQSSTLSISFSESCLYLAALSEYVDLRDRKREALTRGTLLIGPNAFLQHATVSNHVFIPHVWASLGFGAKAWVQRNRVLPVDEMRLGHWGMSKSRGNVVDLALQLRNHGPDAVRAMLTFGDVWSASNIEHYSRLWERVWRLGSGTARIDERKQPHAGVSQTEEATHEISRLLQRFRVAPVFEVLRRLVSTLGESGTCTRSEENLIRLVAPFAPLLSESLWASRDNHSLVREEGLPSGRRRIVTTVRLRFQLDSKEVGSSEVKPDVNIASALELARSIPALSDVLATHSVTVYGELPDILNFVPTGLEPAGAGVLKMRVRSSN